MPFEMHLLSSVHEESCCTASHHCTSIAAYSGYTYFERQCLAVCGTGLRSGVACRDPETGVEAPHYRPADRAACLQAAVEKRGCGTGGALQLANCRCGWGHVGHGEPSSAPLLHHTDSEVDDARISQ